MLVNPFNPHWGTTQKITTAGTSTAGTPMSKDDKTIRIANPGTASAFVAIGFTAPTADATGLLVRAGETVYLMKGEQTFIAALQLTATTDLYISTGNDGT